MTIPIVFGTIADLVQIGLVASLSQPGGNMTGVTLLSVEVGPKLLELLHQAVPVAAVMALLVNPTNPNVLYLSQNGAGGRAGPWPATACAKCQQSKRFRSDICQIARSASRGTNDRSGCTVWCRTRATRQTFSALQNSYDYGAAADLSLPEV